MWLQEALSKTRGAQPARVHTADFAHHRTQPLGSAARDAWSRRLAPRGNRARGMRAHGAHTACRATTAAQRGGVAISAGGHQAIARQHDRTMCHWRIIGRNPLTILVAWNGSGLRGARGRGWADDDAPECRLHVQRRSLRAGATWRREHHSSYCWRELLQGLRASFWVASCRVPLFTLLWPTGRLENSLTTATP